MNDKISKEMSKYPKFQMFSSAIVGIVIIVSGFLIRQDLITWEMTGGEKVMPRFIFWMHSIIGANGVAFFFLIGGCTFFYNSYRIFKRQSVDSR